MRITLTTWKSKFKLCFSLILFKILLDLSYVYVISPVYAYSGFTISIDSFALVESYIIVIILGLIIPSTIKRPSCFLIWLLGVGTLIPTLSYYAIHSGSRAFMYGILFSFLIVITFSKLSTIKIITLKEGRSIGIIILIIMDFIVAAWLIAKGGLSHFNLDLSKVYDHRREVSELVNVGIWGYVNTWAFKVINPALIGWAFWRERHRLLLLFMALQILFFGISSHKAVLFYPVLIIAGYLLIRKQRALEYLTWGLIFVILGSSFFSLVFDYHWLSTLFIRRIFFVPAQLNFAYYELFSNIGHVYLSNSILSGWINYPFPYPPPNMVSEYVYGNYNCWANNGFLAAAYMHFGYIGMFLFSVIVGLLLWMVDLLVYERLPLWLGISIITVPFFSLFTSADLFTALLTHGIIVAILILFILGSKHNSSTNSTIIGGLHGSSLSS